MILLLKQSFTPSFSHSLCDSFISAFLSAQLGQCPEKIKSERVQKKVQNIIANKKFNIKNIL